jgi:hypothetical protein
MGVSLPLNGWLPFGQVRLRAFHKVSVPHRERRARLSSALGMENWNAGSVCAAGLARHAQISSRHAPQSIRGARPSRCLINLVRALQTFP